MTKRRVERELEEYEDIVESLSPDERLQVYLRAASEGNDDWMDRLIETCPRHRYRIPDLAFTTRCRNVATLSLQAMYDLHTTLLEYVLLSGEHDASLLRGLDEDRTSTEEEIEAGKQRAEQLPMLFGDLYRQYHGYRQFAETVLGVDIETWLGIHPNGTLVLEPIAAILETGSWEERAEEVVNDPKLDPSDDDWTTLDELAEHHYEYWTEAWADVVTDP